METPQQEPIAVIGTACRFPGGSDTPSKLWDLLRSPRNLVKRVPTDRFDSTAYFHPNGSHHGTTDCQDAYFLEEDVTRFDNAFFNIQPAEAEAMDPQQRLLMETIYDSLCAGGQTIEGLRGSRTAVYVGLMCDDWAQMTNRDWDLVPTYAATGLSRAIVSNRVSYFFDWHGPSVTVDTACSSSLVAVHQGVAALRSGESPVAVVAGTNLILAPGMWVAESNLHMLSPTGTSKMWDAAADGYARGEGVAALILKPLGAALRDGDHIDCVIRETGVNQDGRTAGITMPNGSAQADLIRETYLRAGLDASDPAQHPQYFHAHGTGTPAGDPQEAEAISRAFFGGDKVKDQDQLYVGSIKTVIGHTEGTAGLASLIGTSLAMQHGIIPPNLHFNTLSPRVASFCDHLQIATKAQPWPNPAPGQPRRASVNSFGFGGTNAHAIIEAYEPVSAEPEEAAVTAFTPLTVSAASSSALRAMLSDLSAYLKKYPDTNMRDLAYTLQARRSTLTFRTTITCKTASEAVNRIDGLLADDTSGENDLTSRYPDIPQPSILGIFTGQGAQWPRMGAQLIEKSSHVAARITELDRALSSLPAGDRPTWTLRDQLLAEPSVSRLSEAAIAQPLCTAVQLVLVDLLRAAGIQLRAVVGHSSGEIAAAYAAGFLSATDAIRVAYYRGLYAKLARSPSDSNVKGAMMAVSTSFEDASEFCEMEDFAGRIRVAARNSPTSITLSGDEDAIEEAVAIFRDEGRFARQLRVDTAYHSHHMELCAAPYLDALARCNITVGDGNGTSWFSSVVDGQVMFKEAVQQSQYWVDNMTSAVLFAPAIESAHAMTGPFDIALEFGPHPALKGPCLDTMEEAVGHRIPYTGLLARSKDDVDELASALGFVWTQLGAGSVDFNGFEGAISAVSLPRRVVADLPAYPFDHPRSFYTLTRFSGGTRNVHAPPHPLLGRRCVESETADEVSWRNVLRPTENSWLQGHQLQGQTVFPAMGYVAMAVEAAVALASTSAERPLGLISLENVVIGKALAFGDESIGVESKVTMKIVRSTDAELSAQIACHSGLPFDSATPLALNFNATVTVAFHDPEPDTLPAVRADEFNLANADAARLYTQFALLGYNYSPPFTGVRAIHRKMGYATGELEDVSGDGWEDQLLIHPGWLDSAIQTGFAAYCHPHDMRLWSLHVPTAIRSVVINPYYTSRGAGRTRRLQYQSATRESPDCPIMLDIDVFAGEGQSQAFVQFEGLQVKPFAAAVPRDDAVLYARFDYKLAGPDAVAAVGDDEIMPAKNEAVIEAMERVGFFYLRRVYETLTPAETAAALPHYKHLLDFARRMVALVKAGEFATMPQEAMADSPAFIRSLVAKYHHRVDMRVLEASGEHLVAEIRRNGNMLEHLMEDGMLYRFYEEGAGFDVANSWLARVVAQITHHHPRMRILEVGAGTGGSTRGILPVLGDAFATYTFTDVSAGFFERAQERFHDYADRLVFATYNMEQPPADQGFEEGTYDVVIASNVLHATGKIDDTIANARRLLRPGGYLVVYETISNNFMSNNAIFGGLPGWWEGAAADSDRCNGPCLTLDQWDALTRKHGFGGIDTHTPVAHKLQSYSVFACQAVDDRVLSLRQPLAARAPAPSSSDLVVVGGSTAAVGQLAEEVCALLAPQYPNIARLESLEELNTRGLAQGSTVLSLTELDQQYFEARSASKLEALKTLWRHGRTILWATRGARAESPYSAMILGLARCVRYEQPHLNLQVLDFDVTPVPQVLAEELVRLELGERWKKEGANLLWSVEPEVHHVKGQVFIPRLCSHARANDRYNTYRRDVYTEVDSRETTVVLEPTPDRQAFELCTVSPLRVLPAPQRRKGKTVELRVEKSLLQVVKVSEAGFFALCTGDDVETGEPLVAIVDAAVESRVRTPAEWTVRVPESAGAALGAVAAHLLAQSILAAAPPFGTVLVHEADEILKDALDKEAAMEGVRIVFTTAEKKAKTKADAAYIFIHAKLPTRLVQRLLPSDISLFVDLSPVSDGAELVGRGLPPNTATVTTANFVRTEPGAFPNAEIDQVGRALKAACQAVTKKRRASLYEHIPVLPVQDVGRHGTVHAPFCIVDWDATSVQVSLRPIDAGTIFRADGTYLLVGLSGEIGQSLGTWMVAHGARNIVLSSRKPSVHPRYIESIEAAGAIIKVMALDVSRRESVYACYDAIRAEMPPVIGVANGAMVLEDTLFDDLEFASIERSFPPKVDGSVLLDELFYDAPLDFFIMLTSAANITGNTGQSSYIMANQCMTALALQRRDVRGVPGSVMAIGILQGLGYFEHTDLLEKDHFGRMGYRDISEQDLHQLFAEAILAGRPGSTGNSEVITGVAPFRDGPDIQEQLRTDPKFGHFILQNPDDAGIHDPAGGAAGGGKTARPRVRLATVKSRAEALGVVQDAFVDRLKRILMMPPTDAVDPLVSLIELGTDSIMAVDVRSWFLKELDVDVPVLKILGAGETVASLVEEAMGKIPVEILDLTKLEEAGERGDLPPTLAMARKPEGGAAGTTLEEASTNSLSSSSAPTATSGSPPLLPTPLTPPEETGADESEYKMQLGQTPETQKGKEEPADDWRRAIVDSSTEHTEPMTFGQNRFWFLSHYVDDPTTFNIAYLGKLTGPLRADDLATAVVMVAQKHEALRTRFFWSDDESKTPMQGILSQPLVRLETATIESEAQAVQELDAMRDYEWNLGDWVPLRMRLLSLSGSDTVHFLVIGTHHISLDGHSLNVLMLDINAAYNRPSHPLPTLPYASQARDFGAQQRAAQQSGQFRPAIDYFRGVLPPADLTHPIELFSFARKQVRPPLDVYDTHVSRIRLEPQVAAKLKQLARGHRATPFHAYLAALQALLFQLLPADTTDKVFVGIADANRLDSRFMGTIGNVLNVLPMRFDRDRSGGHRTFGEAVEAAREAAHGALRHSGLPFDLLLDELAVPRSNAWAPVFQVFMDYRLVVREHADKRLVGCRIDEDKWHVARSGYDVALEIVEDHEGAMLAVHAQKALYDANGAELLARSYANVLREVARQGGKVKVESLERWDGGDVERALDIGKGLDMQLEWPATVAHRIDQVIAQHAHSVALKDGYGRVMTYADMDERVESIARALREQVHKSNEQAIFGVFQMPSADWICSLLAIHRVGAVYLPLDLRNSVPRLKRNVEVARPVAILTDSETTGRTNEIVADKHVVSINVSDLNLAATAEARKKRGEPAAKPNDTAYIIFTSGSTGEPKGIVVTHAGLRVNLEGYHRAWSIPTLAGVVLQQAAFSFDASLLQVYAALTTGGCLLVVPADARGDPAEVTRLMADHGVTMTQATPSEYDMWFRFAPDTLRQCTNWKAAWFGGERAAPGLLDGFRDVCRALPELRVFTSYGPTESTVSAMKGEADVVGNPSLTVPVPGRLLPNYAAYIVDEEMRPLPVGVPGEIMLGGAAVGANEYLHRPDLTAAQYLPDPFFAAGAAAHNNKNGDKREKGWGRMYRTGDYGRLDARGFLTVEGRIAGDTQVKLRGFRIELVEIERVMIEAAGGALAMAVVTLRGGADGDGDGFLAAHVVFKKGQSQGEEQDAEKVDRLRARLPLCLPQYMCPAVIVPLDEVPLTAHHKVDRRAVERLPLPEMEGSIEEQQQQNLILTPTERRLAELWTAVFPQRGPATKPLGPRSDFFSAGGNSLLLVKLQAGIRRVFGDAPRLSKLMSAAELGAMAALLDSGVAAVDWDKEIALEPDLLDHAVPQQVQQARGLRNGSGGGLRVLITGATGSLGRRIVLRLAADERVARVVCLVRPAEGRELTVMKLFPSVEKKDEDKVLVVQADLQSLPATDIADLLAKTEVNAVLHCAADRTFWDGYSAVRPVNVDVAKTLAELCVRAGAPLHVLSSGAVAAYDADDEADDPSSSSSQRHLLPRPNPADGYVASKWVAERYLARAARSAGLQVTAHRPTKKVDSGGDDEDGHVRAAEKETEATIAGEMVLLSARLGVRPDFTHLGGTIDATPLEGVAGVVAGAVIAEAEAEKSSGQKKGMRIVNYPGTARIRTEALAACYAEEVSKSGPGREKNEEVRGLPSVPALHWVGLAKQAGLFEWLFTAQELVITDGEGRKVVTRR